MNKIDPKLKTSKPAKRRTGERTPVRAPGRARVERVIESAMTLLKTHAPDAITISMIAIEASISRTSIYEFFPTVASIYRVIAERNVEELATKVRAYVATYNPKTLEQLVDTFIDGTIQHFNSHPAAMKVYLGSDAEFQLRAVIHDFDITAASMYHSFFKVDWDIEPLSERDPIRTLIILQTSLFSMSVQRHGEITAAVSDEVKLMARAYIGQYSDDIRPWPGSQRAKRGSDSSAMVTPPSRRKQTENRFRSLLTTLDDDALDVALKQTALLAKLYANKK